MDIAEHLREEFQLRVFEESYPRIQNCLERISQDQLWQAPNENTVSIGCLIKHLMGNMQQWMYSGVLNHPFQRDRDAEFVPAPMLSQDDLLREMEVVRKRFSIALKDLTESLLSANLEIQGFQVSGLSACVHVIEHFSYHTGQIALLTKLLVNQDLGFYDGMELDQD